MRWTTVEHVRRRWVGAPPPPADEILARWVSDAEVLVAAASPDIDERIAVDDTLLDRVRLVVSRMVIRSLKNPNSLRSTTQQAGPFSITSTVGGDDPGGLWLSDDDRQLLARASRRGPRAFTIDPTPPDAYRPTPLWRLPGDPDPAA